MSESTHAPLPLVVCEGDDWVSIGPNRRSESLIADMIREDGRQGGLIPDHERARMIRVAREIVRRVNCHATMKETLEELSVGLQCWLEAYGDHNGRIAQLLGMVNETIEKTEGT